MSSATTSRAAPANSVPCMSGGACGETTGWHYQGSEAHLDCQRAADRASAAERMNRAAAVGNSTSANADGSRQRLSPLRALEEDEKEMLEAMRQTAISYLPFYTHMLYKFRPVAVDEEPIQTPDGPVWSTLAAITPDWRLIINYDWVRNELAAAYEKHGPKIREQMLAEGITPTDEAVRIGSNLIANDHMGKVLLHEAGHAMYNTWDWPEKHGIDPTLLNQAEDAVINNSLRVLGSKSVRQGDEIIRLEVPKENINGEFLEGVIYGGSVPCDDPGHSWRYRDPKTGEVSSRCDYEQTIQHYYDAFAKEQEKQEQDQGSKGQQQSDDDPGPPGDSPGQSRGQQGGSDRERQDRGGASSDPSGDGDAGGDGQAGGQGKDEHGGQGSGSRGKGGDERGTQRPGCGREQAQKYADDPLEKGTINEASKENSLDATAKAIEDWAAQNPDSAKHAGFGEGSMARKWASRRRRTDGIKWNKVLNQSVRRSVESLKTKRETYSRRRRRDAAMGSVIRRGTRDGYMPSIVAAIDTSGSMSPDDLYMAYNSVRSVIKRTGITKLDAFAVDYNAKSVPVSIKKAEDLAPLLTGGGGTDMCAGIEHAAASGNDLCIVFTDAEVGWDAMATRPDHINMDVIIGVISDNDERCTELAAQVPSWMKTVKINKELLAEHREGSSDGDGPFMG